MTVPIGPQLPPPRRHPTLRRILITTGSVLGGLFVVFCTLGILGATGVLPAPDPSSSPTPANTRAVGHAPEPTEAPSHDPTTSPASPRHHPTTPAAPRPTTSAPPTAAPGTTAPGTAPPAAAPPGKPASGTSASAALAALAKLPVEPAASMAGYSRDMFGHGWIDTDHNGCDTRNDILRRDLGNLVVRAGTHGCVVMSGALRDQYTGTVISFHRGEGTSDAVEIDHVVALADAWRTGAQGMSPSQREQLANDPIELLAVSGSANESKGDQDASQWLPPHRSFDCAYVADQITVKARYGLWVTRAEHDAMASTLRQCGGVGSQPRTTAAAPPSPRPARTQAPPATHAPPTTQAPPPADDGGGQTVVHPGAFCSPKGAVGVTDRGTPMRCTSKNGDQPRWRSAG
ncbi:DUF1524 domain-containing protein [Actinocatenispora sera]|uniref:HNH endonuclease family protein n=1 Tax=Actinocatenispora sera TaxID=390989 RepID=UPI0033C46E61